MSTDKFKSFEYSTKVEAEFVQDEFVKLIKGRIHRNAMLCLRMLGEFAMAEPKFPIETPWGDANSLTELMNILVRRQATIACSICDDAVDEDFAAGQIESVLYDLIERGEEPSLAVLKETRDGFKINAGIFPKRITD